MAQELLLEAAEETFSCGAAFTTEAEPPSIEMAEDLKEPGNDDGGDSGGTEINTSAVDVQQEQEILEREAATHEVGEEDSASIRQEPRLSTLVEEAVASGSECRPVENSDLSVPLLSSSSLSSGHSHSNREIQQENIKHALHEIISEIDREMEADLSNEEVSYSV